MADEPEAVVRLRRFPFPYRSMLAICSDLDETPDRSAYLEIARFLNTDRVTSMGDGVNLEVGNTIYFDMPPDQFAYWTTDDRGRAMIQALGRSGHIDCIHSFGDLATTRAHAARALEELHRHDCRLEVWIDHATAATNFGADIMRGSGDVPGTAAYHADLTTAYGIRFVWRGRVTSIIGQGVRRSLTGIFDPQHPARSTVTAAKELVKGVLSRRGNRKYQPHAKNAVTYPAELRDGRPVTEFLRANPHFRGVSGADTAAGFPEVLTARFVDRLVAREGFCILYTHLGKTADPYELFSVQTCNAFRRLAARQASGDVLVTTTRRLLGYVETSQRIRIATDVRPGMTTIRAELKGIEAPFRATASDLDGLTFYVPATQPVEMVLNGEDVTPLLLLNSLDHTGRTSVSLPWRRLTFPHDL
jgi:hypothetical protein